MSTKAFVLALLSAAPCGVDPVEARTLGK